MGAIFEAIFEVIFEFIFECLGGLVSSKRVPKGIRILILSVILVPLILLMASVSLKNLRTEIAVSIICFIIMLVMLLAYIIILLKTKKGTPLEHKKKERT